FLLAALALVGLLTAGWYAIPQAQVYEVAGERSGAALAAGTLAGAAGAALPLAIGLVASAAGLQVALWVPLAAPLALLALVPRARQASAASSVTSTESASARETGQPCFAAS